MDDNIHPLSEEISHKGGDVSAFARMLTAKIFGYFWLPCPICGEFFGGFETGNGHVTLPDGANKVCCKKCDYEAGKIAILNDTDPFLTPKASRHLRKEHIVRLKTGTYEVHYPIMVK